MNFRIFYRPPSFPTPRKNKQCPTGINFENFLSSEKKWLRSGVLHSSTFVSRCFIKNKTRQNNTCLLLLSEKVALCRYTRDRKRFNMHAFPFAVSRNPLSVHFSGFTAAVNDCFQKSSVGVKKDNTIGSKKLFQSTLQQQYYCWEHPTFPVKLAMHKI